MSTKPQFKQGIIYLIQKREHARLQESLFKIGRTDPWPKSRFKLYEDNSAVLLIRLVNDAIKAETELKQILNAHESFERIQNDPDDAKTGTETYHGDPIEMINIINEYCNKAFRYDDEMRNGLKLYGDISATPKSSRKELNDLIMQNMQQVSDSIEEEEETVEIDPLEINPNHVVDLPADVYTDDQNSKGLGSEVYIDNIRRHMSANKYKTNKTGILMLLTRTNYSEHGIWHVDQIVFDPALTKAKFDYNAKTFDFKQDDSKRRDLIKFNGKSLRLINKDIPTNVNRCIMLLNMLPYRKKLESYTKRFEPYSADLKREYRL